MNTRTQLWCYAILTFILADTSLIAQGTAFTYQGRLNDGGSPANGNYDLQFTIYGALSNGSAVAGPTVLNDVAVSNGLFTVALDFGNQFPGAARWLEIAVRTNGGGSYSNLVPRQRITAAPYAITASNVSGTISAGQLSGAIPLAQLPATVVTNGAGGVNLTGAFSGNGAGVTNVPLVALNSAGIITWPGNFVLASSPFVGSAPWSVTAADVNGDGKVDLISANANDNTLSVLTNNGGGFVLASSPSVVGGTPQSVTAADVNGDGKVDLIGASYFSGTLSVLTNNGSGGFLLASLPGTGPLPYSVTAADVNGDGKVDLIIANNTFSGTLSVLTNNGSGGFGLAALPGVGSRPRSVAAADVNGDGKVDLISANSGNATLSVLTNNGSGGFGLASSPNVGGLPYSVVAADVNGDGKVDLISANAGGSTLSVLLNTPTFAGAFTGNGAGLTGLNAANITGTLVTAQIPNLDASKITTGTLTDARLSANVALRAGGNTFSGDQIVTTGSVGIGTASPGRALQVGDAAIPGSEGMIRLGSRTSTGNNVARTWDVGVPQTGDDASGTGYSFVIKDTLQGSATNSTPEFMIKYVTGYVGLGTNAPQEKLHVIGNIRASGSICANNGVNCVSDRNAKRDFAPVNSREVLEKVAGLPLSEWSYKTDSSGTRHIGPMAQDFYAAFEVGLDEKSIATVDADGVALAAIQGLNQKLETENSELRKELADLKEAVQKLARSR